MTKFPFAMKAEVDALDTRLDVVEAQSPRLPRYVRAATVTALPANTRSGNVLTASANGAMPAQDTVSLSVGNSLLVKDEANKVNNGLFTVTSLGSGSTPWVLTRHPDADASSKIVSGMTVYVSEGSRNRDQEWRLATNDPIALNTTGLSFIKSNPIVSVETYGAVADGTTDDSAAFQAAIDANPGGVRITCTPGRTYALASSVLLGEQYIDVDLGGAKLLSTASSGTKMFKSSDATQQSTVKFRLRNGNIDSNNTIVDAQLVGSAPNDGIDVLLEDLNVTGNRTSDFFVFRQADFLSVRRVKVWGSNRVFVVESDWSNSERDNTQIHFYNVGINDSNLGIYARQCDKMSLIGVDISGCSTGIHIGRECKRVQHIACHVEWFGTSTFSYSTHPGVAYYAENNGNFDISYQDCSTLFPGSSAVASYETGAISSTSFAAVMAYRECHAAQDSGVSGYITPALWRCGQVGGTLPVHCW